MPVSSKANPQFQSFLSLTKSKGLKEEGQFLLSGDALISEFLRKPHLPIVSEILTEKMSRRTSHSQTKPLVLSSELFRQIDALGTDAPILVLQQPKILTWKALPSSKGLTLLCPLGDPTNLGALARSAEAFGVQNFVLLQEAAHPFLPKSVKSSAGSITRLTLHRGPSLRELAALNLFPLVGLDMRGESLGKFTWPENVYLLVGEEGAGLPQIPKMKIISIPTQTVESLNATVAASLALYDYRLKFFD